MKKLFYTTILCFAVSTTSYAAVAPVSVSIIPPVQFPADDWNITGLRTSIIYGDHRNVYGFDFGLLGNVTQQDFVGIGISGVANVTHGSTHAIGLQLAGLVNVNTNKTNVYGLQVTAGVNVNTAQSAIYGVQLGLIGNFSSYTDIYGFQIGLINRANNVYGFQIGLVNQAVSLHGIQLGLVNINEKGLFKISPAINIGF
jgi:hypothetical protein